ncbi:potassium voltage-gated channel subfamily G member 4-like [Gouania willdenowi]|uniref:Potassium voltage-gated channel subfamily G member 4-like n=1 Tax=Gouania willdenowi TaxID=441366 RepID=A0A8C5EEY8_GOUWI|nr:potassium voltage-gated channel subfamily G member 4-like [Gouania willdenowi]
MAIIGAGFDDQSISSDGSYGHYFTDAEDPPVKGVYFQRGKLLGGPETSKQVIDPFSLALINVGGMRYTFPWNTLEDFPHSRFGRLLSCTSQREIATFCDDYDSARQEFFFDRDPLAFRAIFCYMAKGKLRQMQDVCNVALHTELLYWGIDVEEMAPCCRHNVKVSVEDVVLYQNKEEEWRKKRRALREPVAQDKLFHMLGEAVDNPHSGALGKVFAFLSVIMVLVTVVSVCIGTISEFQEQDALGERSQKCRYMFIVESVCVAWFTCEFLLRFFHASNKLEFFLGPFNIIDAGAILPFYVTLFLELRESMHDIVAGAGRSTIDKLGLILRVMRALRILYVMKLARHSVGLQTLGLTIQRSLKDFGLLLLFVCVAVTLFSPLVHLTESELAPNSARSPQLSFSSIPASYWWSIISVTTVGYGDMVPHSIPGQLVALIVIVSGILLLSFPSTSIFHTFAQTYTELKTENERLWKEERGAELATEAEESMRERETWPDN